MKKMIHIFGARQNNLKNISLNIPKHQIVVFTGVSGSGKSSLVFETIGAEAQRQINETQDSFTRNRLKHMGHADVDKIENLNVPVIIDQKPLSGSIRSTVGTATDIYASLRLLFSRLGEPFVGYSQVFSFNHPDGMCPQCEGTGLENTLDIYKILDQEKSLNEHAILFPTYQPQAWRWQRYAYSGYFDLNKKLKDYTKNEWDLLLYAPQHKPKNPTKDWKKTALYEGLVTRFERNFMRGQAQEKNRYKARLDKIIDTKTCSLCHGQKLKQQTLKCKIHHKNIAECTSLSIQELIQFIDDIHAPKYDVLLHEIKQKLQHLLLVGLSYLSLDRVTTTLSGGESQRIKMVKHLGNSLVDLMYIFDEPSVGLHPHDLENIIQIIKQLRDKGNTILLVEHDPDLIKIADHIIDVGPKSGIHGGEIVYEGSFKKLKYANTLTGQFFAQEKALKAHPRVSKDVISIQHANMFNLKDISVNIPKNVLTVVTGVAGSGKSTLIGKVLLAQYPEAKLINQSAIMASIRSNLLTYLDLSDHIRHQFAQANHVSMKLFSYNSEGACPHCKGLGIEKVELAFLDDIEIVCEVCHGTGYKPEVLKYQYQNKNITEVMKMTVEEASYFFQETKIQDKLQLLIDLGLDYLSLGQRLSTLSGGERQRLKLTKELKQNGHIIILDEPSTGLHPSDTFKLIELLNYMVDQGNTVITIEHNLDIMTQADWIIDIGPFAGREGGELIFSGYPKDLIRTAKSLTGQYLAQYLKYT
ncbi:ATP-binding cassette domain-containing protein [Acinetobacter pollinis]|uniref:ATP-binding cassette domain-containing protein n=1 Tax=Acinetobacter pollinis TaxID=2605270 RepID=UPI0018C2554C|nr:excinuclease ABC subunit UvrA [Acinetobacter pollinis]MBF7691848.1 excinuclease ABC subunit UvrA [Acinetobacter pollinis]MBF7699953.1 excinuclease ABC subunit UvrA [Acinetobacter pollinis]